jgi:hypothetical protein
VPRCAAGNRLSARVPPEPEREMNVAHAVVRVTPGRGPDGRPLSATRPAKLTWTVPVEVQDLAVPLEFRDLPLP